MTLIEAIAREEGWGVAEDIPSRDNNPGDIDAGKFAACHGESGVDRRFAVFPDAATGFAALRELLTEAYLGMTLEDALNKYAPPVENNTSAYLDNVCKWTGLTPATVLTEGNIG